MQFPLHEDAIAIASGNGREYGCGCGGVMFYWDFGRTAVRWVCGRTAVRWVCGRTAVRWVCGRTAVRPYFLSGLCWSLLQFWGLLVMYAIVAS